MSTAVYVGSAPAPPATTARGGLAGGPRPLWIGRALALVAGILLVAYPLLSDDIYYQNMLILSLVFAIGASGLNIITGFAGYVSLGQGAFIGLGGYTDRRARDAKFPDTYLLGSGCRCRGLVAAAAVAFVARSWSRCAREDRRS